MFLMWLGEQITERGLGNGISIIIFAGIAAGLPNAIGGTLELVRTGAMSIRRRRCSSSRWSVAVTCVRRASSSAASARSWSTTPSARSATRSTAARRSHLPLKLNMSGVIPPIFASSIILFPATLVELVRAPASACAGCSDMAGDCCRPGQPIYVMLYAAAIVFFCFFYTALRLQQPRRRPTT